MAEIHSRSASFPHEFQFGGLLLGASKGVCLYIEGRKIRVLLLLDPVISITPLLAETVIGNLKVLFHLSWGEIMESSGKQ